MNPSSSVNNVPSTPYSVSVSTSQKAPPKVRTQLSRELSRENPTVSPSLYRLDVVLSVLRERSRWFRAQAMRFLGRRKSTSKLPDVSPGSSSLYGPSPRQGQHNLLALPTRLDEVADSMHDCVPQHLPGERASQEDVRYFLYQVLTLKDYNLARKSPQWVLETCMLWQGNGDKLRSLPLEAFQQLCPLHPGYAAIDWTVKRSKFRRQDIPPCGVRDDIGHRIKNIVEILKKREEGHRRPGWQSPNNLSPIMTAPPAEIGRRHSTKHPAHHGFPIASFAQVPEFPVQNHFYSLGNHSMPLLHQMPPMDVQKYPPNLRRTVPLGGPNFTVGPARQRNNYMGNLKLMTDDPLCQHSPPAPLSCSPISSYCQTGSMLSRLTESTAKSSPPNSENEHNFWFPKDERSPSTTQSISGSHYAGSSMYQDPLRRTPSTKPSRYKGKQLTQPTHLDDRSFHPVNRMAHLRSPSCSAGSLYTPSEASLTPSDSATNRHGLRRSASISSPESMQKVLRHGSPYVLPAASRPLTRQTSVSTLPSPRSLASSGPDTVTPTVCVQNDFARPINNYKVDAHALGTAELVAFKSMPGPVRSLMADEERCRKLSRGKSNSRLDIRLNISPKNVLGQEDSVGPFVRFQNPRTGQPRLTIYETIEQQERLGRQQLEGQRCVEPQRRRLRTVYETIEEQELLDKKPQRGVDSGIEREWSGYL
ncbi:hypothetical protein OPT61_g949 [Boeremia exigua]|uniref:Uncharacterized protein n=1 Tax=Boeremia exigua TaxID=749465 RepID=A0ACC2IRY7_9PLEO|nr:hypothetical protein OPT61_g949 [Boeremia exigua]